MQLTGKNAEYADLILSKLMDNGGWISKDEILGILHDTYNYAAEPEFVLHDLGNVAEIAELIGFTASSYCYF